MNKIVYCINGDKFTDGYIKYINKNFSNFNNIFFYKKNNSDVESGTNIFGLNSWKELIKKPLKNELLSADLIIISGVFEIKKILYRFNSKLLKKTFLQFWGGDFYPYKKCKIISKSYLTKLLLYYYIKKCKGILTLIPDDYEELKDIYKKNKPHFTVPVLEEKNYTIDYKKCINSEAKGNKIIVGNSSTKSNYHIEVLELLSKFKNNDIEIICPLSYGDNEYKKDVIKKGKEIFGKKFKPLTKFMNYSDYMELLAQTKVAIFNNNRQQALSNINSLIKMGKKVYLRNGTSMWKDFKKFDLKIFDINTIPNQSFDQFMEFSKDRGLENYKKMLTKEDYYNMCWKNFFDEVL